MAKVKTKHPSRAPQSAVISSGWLTPLMFSVLFIVGFLIYSNTFNSSFHFDDQPNLVHIPEVRSPDLVGLWRSLGSRTATYFTFAVNFQISQFALAPLHITNTLIHIFAACLVFFLSRHICATAAPLANNFPPPRFAFWCALIFLCHPIQTQAVTYIVQRTTSLAGFFYLAAVYFYALYRKKSARYWLCASGVFALGAFMSKENTFTLPAVLFAYELFFARKKESLLKKGIRISPYILMIVLILSAEMIRSPMLRQEVVQVQSHPGVVLLSRPHYFFTQINVVRTYLRLVFFPVNQNLDYDYPVSMTLFEPHTLASLALILSVIGLGAWLYKRLPVVSFGIFWFFLTLSIESSIFPIADVIFEHRLYLPMFGFALAFVAGLSAFIANGRWLRNILTTICVILSLMTFARNRIWRDEVTLWEDTVKKSPRKARALDNLGASYGELGYADTAIRYIEQAIEANPKYARAYFNLGAAYKNKKDWPRAIEAFKKAIELPPPDSSSYQYLGEVYLSTEEYDKAIECFQKSIEMRPARDRYNNLAYAYYKKQDYDTALTHYFKTIEMDPRFSDGFYNIGLTYQKKKDPIKAIEYFLHAVLLNPKSSEFFNSLGSAYSDIGRYDEAIGYFQRASEIAPADPAAYYHLGVAYHKLGRREEALAMAAKLEALDNPDALRQLNEVFNAPAPPAA